MRLALRWAPSPSAAIHTPLTVALDRARADWLAGDAAAWTRYRVCTRQIETFKDTRAVRPDVVPPPRGWARA